MTCYCYEVYLNYSKYCFIAVFAEILTKYSDRFVVKKMEVFFLILPLNYRNKLEYSILPISSCD